MEESIEDRAAGVLSAVPDWIWNGDTLPVPVEHIADSCFGLHVRDVGDLTSAPGVPSLQPGQSLSGLLLPGLGEIWVNAAEARDWPSRRRFTIGHELGHWCLHRAQGAVWCRSQTVDPPEDGGSDRAEDAASDRTEQAASDRTEQAASDRAEQAAPDRAEQAAPDPAQAAGAAPRRAYPPEESEANEFAAALLMPAHLVQRHYERLRRRDPDGCFAELCRVFGASGAAMGRRLRRVV